MEDLTGAGHTLSILIQDSSQSAEARRMAAAIAHGLGFDETMLGKISIVATEMATNIVKHGGGGEMLVRQIDGPPAGVELIALDSGRGMIDVAAAMRDGYSTAGSPGNGLGAIERQASSMEIYSQPGKGTAVLARFLRPSLTPSHDCFSVGAVSVPKAGEVVCGDGWCAIESGDRLSVLVADGLGHGPHAAAASQQAITFFRTINERSPGQIIEMLHGAIRATRGAAISVAEIRPRDGSVVYAGVGNISGTIVAESSTQRMISLNGTVGMHIPNVQEFTYRWPERASLVMHSDGLATQWDLSRYPRLDAYSPTIASAVIYRDHTRRRDDTTVVVVREAESR